MIKRRVKGVDATFTRLTNELQFQYDWRDAPYTLRERFYPGEEVFEKTRAYLARLAQVTRSLAADLDRLISGLPPEDDEGLDRITREIMGRVMSMAEAASALEYMCEPTDPDSVYWWESPYRKDSVDSRVCWVPLDVAERMHTAFHSQKRSVVFTSATMTVAHNFEYINERLGLDLIEKERLMTMELGSPYEFQSQLLVLFPDYLPEPGKPGYLPEIADLIGKISRETRAGSLGLFTSYRALKKTYGLLAGELAEEGILALAQGVSGGRSQITRRFTEDRESVLLGTQSFWQGVDVRGESLQILYLTRIPFSVPTDPYFSAQCERIQRLGGDPFGSYTVPKAVIKFRQGIGRLIRGEEDVGALVLCDRRLGTRAYGRAFLMSLPVEFEVVSTTMELVQKIKRFL
mgnify:FL=1